MTAPAKQRLVETALTLFHRNGFHATGIDRILAEAGVSKMTLYKHFKSKDDLILAVLDLRDRRFRQWLNDRTLDFSDDPKARLLAVFDALAEWFDDPGFHGCLFINAAAEFGLPTDRIHQSAAHHKKLVLEWLTEITAQAGLDDPPAMAWRLMLIMEGAIVVRQAACDGQAAHKARELAEILLKGHHVPLAETRR